MKSDELEIRDVITRGIHVIPNYQRSYAWTSSNIDDYWQDVLGQKLGHFLGSFVVKSGKGNTKDVIDGQQRITTSIIALSALRDTFIKYGRGDYATGVHENFIYFKNEIGQQEERLVNANSDVQNMLVQNIFAIPEKRGEHQNQDRLQRKEIEAYLKFIELIEAEISDLSSGEDVAQRLDEIRSKVLGAQVVYIEVDSERAAFRIFETLNDRGVGLSTADLVKNYLFQYLGDDPEVRATDIWEEILSSLEGLHGASLDIEDFIYYAWNSRFGPRQNETSYVVKDKILRSVSEYVEKTGVAPESDDEGQVKKNARELLNYFRFCAQLITVFQSVINSSGESGAWDRISRKAKSISRDELNNDLYGVLLTQAQQPMVLLFALFYSYFHGAVKITAKMLRRFLKRIHHFQFRWSIAQKSSSDILRRPYRVAAAKIHMAKNSNDIKNAFDEFVVLTAGKVTDIQFAGGIEKLAVSKSDGKDAFKVRFILREVDFYENGASPRKISWSLEHIQGLAGRSEKTPRNSWIFKIGNILLLPDSVNNELPQDFVDKVEVLKKHVNLHDRILISALNDRQWNVSLANKRKDDIGEIATRVWPLGESVDF